MRLTNYSYTFVSSYSDVVFDIFYIHLLNGKLMRQMEFQDGLFRVSDNDIVVSRRRVCDFLAQKNAYDLLPDSGKVMQICGVSLSFPIFFLVIYFPDVFCYVSTDEIFFLRSLHWMLTCL